RDLVQPTDDRIQRAFLCEMGEVPPEFIQRGGIAFPVALPRRALPQERDGQLAGSQEIGPEAPENLPADAFLLTEQAQQEMLAADVVMAQQPGLFDRVLDDFLHPRAEGDRSEEHTSELQSRVDLVCRLLLEKKKY